MRADSQAYISPAMTSRIQPDADRVAQLAARLVMDGDASSVRGAIEIARAQMGNTLRSHGAATPAFSTIPSVKRVREHLQAMTMQRLGAEGYRERRLSLWRAAEEIMTVLERYDPELVGRSAEGLFDGDVRFLIRLYTSADVSEIAQLLVDFEYDEPAFTTADSKTFGRFSRVEFDEDGIPVVLTRILPKQQNRVGKFNLFTGKPIAIISLDTLRQTLSQQT